MNVARGVEAEFGEQVPLKPITQLVVRGAQASGGTLKTLEGSSSVINSISISASGSYLVSAGNDCTVQLWDTGSGKCIRTMTGHTEPVRVVKLTPDGKSALSGGWDGTLCLWDLEFWPVLYANSRGIQTWSRTWIFRPMASGR